AHRTHDDIHGQRCSPIEHTGAAPSDREAQKQQRIREVDGNRLAHAAVHAEEHNGACPQQMCAAPPGDGRDLRVLNPGEQKMKCGCALPAPKAKLCGMGKIVCDGLTGWARRELDFAHADRTHWAHPWLADRLDAANSVMAKRWRA